MAPNCRSAFTRYLRKEGIQYTTFPHRISIGWYHFYFDDDAEYITLHHTQTASVTYNFPYCTPGQIIQKLLRYYLYMRSRIDKPCPELSSHFVNRNGELTTISIHPHKK